MPGYEDQVVMAAVLSFKELRLNFLVMVLLSPYIAYMQGGLVWEQGKLATMLALS